MHYEFPDRENSSLMRLLRKPYFPIGKICAQISYASHDLSRSGNILFILG